MNKPDVQRFQAAIEVPSTTKGVREKVSMRYHLHGNMFLIVLGDNFISSDWDSDVFHPLGTVRQGV
jgi:hypothetical protein